jgi:hypothetical protein
MPVAAPRIARHKAQAKTSKIGILERAEAPFQTPTGTSALTIGMWPMAASRITLQRLTNQRSEWRPPDRLKELASTLTTGAHGSACGCT